MTAPTLFSVEAPAATTAAGPRPAATITVYGEPGPQGSKRHVGNGVMVESSKKVKPWRQDVKYAAIGATAHIPGWKALHGPLAVAMTFTFARIKSHYRTGRYAHLLKDGAPAQPTVYPDLSKIVRSTEDALTGVVWKDDAQVVQYVRLGKWYAGADAPDVLAVPGCVIRVWRLAEAVTR